MSFKIKWNRFVVAIRRRRCDDFKPNASSICSRIAVHPEQPGGRRGSREMDDWTRRRIQCVPPRIEATALVPEYVDDEGACVGVSRREQHVVHCLGK